MPTVGLLLLIGGALLLYEAARSLGASVGTSPATPAVSGQQSSTQPPSLQGVPVQPSTAAPTASGGSAYSAQVQNDITTALSKLGVPSTWLQPLLFIQSKESGGYSYQEALSVIPPGQVAGGPNTPTGLFQVKFATYNSLIPMLTPECRDASQITNGVCSAEAAIARILTAWGGNPNNIPGVGNAQVYTGY